MLATLPLYSAHDLCAALRTADPRRGPPVTDRLDRPLACSPSLGRIEVQVGTPWPSVGRALAEQAGVDGAAFAAAFEPLGASVGAAVDALPPLPDGTPFSHAIESLAIVTADGELRCASRTRHADLLRLVLGGHGAIALPYSVTLRIPVLAIALHNAQAPVEFAPSDPAAHEATDVVRLFLPPSRLPEWLEDARHTAEDYGISIKRIRVRRASAGSESFLETAAAERAVVDVHTDNAATLPARAASAQARRAWVTRALECGGSFDLDTGFDASRAQVAAAYPRFSAFLAEARRLDPHGRLAGRWMRHYAALFACGPVSGRWTQA